MAKIAGRYSIVEELGSGAFATTYKCEAPDGQVVALKALPVAGLENWEPLELFEREAQVMRGLDHPQIPAFVEAFEGETLDGKLAYFIAQEFIEGQTLASHIADKRAFGDDELVELTEQLLDVLDYLHSRKPPVLHRDIKPSNIMLPPEGRAVLIDFGGVRYGWRPPNESGTTIIGTVGYMPQEQLLGQAGPSSDLYALGATILHAATGRAPNEFPFETGQYELDGIDVGGGLLLFLTEVLRAAPSRRPQSAELARAVLRSETALVPVGPRKLTHSDNPHLSRKERALEKWGEAWQPRFVEMPPPPRSTDGEFRDVYEVLVHGFIQGPSQVVRPRWYHQLFYGSFTFGIIPIANWVTRRKRRKRYEPLFVSGIFTRGAVNSVGDHEIAYEFTVGTDRYEGEFSTRPDFIAFFERGDIIGVLYNENDPTKSTAVFRYGPP